MIRRFRRTLVIMGAVAVVFVLSAVLISTQARAAADRKLEMVHVVMRHGIRTPASTYPNDPYADHTFYPIGWGQITNEGKVELYNIGKYLRERYGDFLGNRYTPDIYYTQSTDVDRTKASMQLVNAGLWPPQEDQKWGTLNWQPIPVHAEPLDEDMLLLVRKPCAQYHIEREKVMNSEEVKDQFLYYDGLFRELTELTGLNVTDFDGVQDIYSTLRAEEKFNLTLPEWTNLYYPDKLLEPTIYSFILNSYNDKMNRLKGGVLLKKIITDWITKAAGSISPSDRKAFLYGGHDSTVSNLMRTLKIWDPQIPDYSITVLLELWKDASTDDYGVEIHLRNSTNATPYKMTVPGCDSFCPLEKLVTLMENVLPRSWADECRTDRENYIVPSSGAP